MSFKKYNIPIDVKKRCCELRENGLAYKDIYDQEIRSIGCAIPLTSFKSRLREWLKESFPDDTTLEAGTYKGFTAHDATVQVSATGEIIQAWIKQKADEIDVYEFFDAIRGSVEPYDYKPKDFEQSSHMLEIPLFDMHWGISFMDHYKPVLDELIELMHSRSWDKIVIPFGQDFFHNDSIVNGVTTKGTQIEKVDMTRAVREGKQFMFALIDNALACSNEVKVLYSPGNHDRSISWMFIQVLLERYGPDVVDDSLEYRKVISYGKNSIMVTHGDSKQATPKNLAHVFPIAFAEEFANSNIREVHAGHLHHETDTDVFGVMVRRLSSAGKLSEWSDKGDFIGAHKRFMVFDWGLDKLKSIHYI